MSKERKKDAIMNMIMALKQCRDFGIVIEVDTDEDDNDTGYFARTIKFYDCDSKATHTSIRPYNSWR